jgi:hypothetical protein
MGLIIFKEKFIPTLNRNIERSSHTVIVVHDYRDISENVIPLVKNYNLITMRKTVQEYLKSKYELDSSFVYHPFYPYPVVSREPREGAVSISRISFEKNTDTILKANKILGHDQSIRIYGCPGNIYVYRNLDGSNGEFSKYYSTDNKFAKEREKEIMQ